MPDSNPISLTLNECHTIANKVKISYHDLGVLMFSHHPQVLIREVSIKFNYSNLQSSRGNPTIHVSAIIKN